MVIQASSQLYWQSLFEQSRLILFCEIIFPRRIINGTCTNSLIATSVAKMLSFHFVGSKILLELSISIVFNFLKSGHSWKYVLKYGKKFILQLRMFQIICRLINITLFWQKFEPQQIGMQLNAVFSLIMFERNCLHNYTYSCVI